MGPSIWYNSLSSLHLLDKLNSSIKRHVVLKLFKFNPSMDKQSQALENVGRNYLSIPKLNGQVISSHTLNWVYR